MTDIPEIDDYVDAVVASCDGDLRGALKALLLVNEQLERELQRVTVLATRPRSQTLAGSAFH